MLLIMSALYIVALIFWGSRRNAGFASWHMFADLHKMEFHLRCRLPGEAWREFNPWDYLPHTHLSMSLEELRLFLGYLKKIKGLQLEGHVIYYCEGNITQINVLGGS